MVAGAQQAITNVVTSWDGVTAHPHRFGGVEYRLGSREIGHIHGDSMLDIPFPVKVRQELIDQGRAQPHHLLPETGWISFYIRQPDDVERAVELLRRSCEIARGQIARRASAQPGAAPTHS